eukprot:UN23414
MIKNEDIKKLMFSGSKTKLVFISMCNSGMVAEHFVKMGVEHVVAVDCQQKVKESVAMSFAQQFYSHVFSGETIKVAFKKAENFCEFKHVGSKIPFLLLPPEKNMEHNVTFEDMWDSVKKVKPSVNDDENEIEKTKDTHLSPPSAHNHQPPVDPELIGRQGPLINCLRVLYQPSRD